MDTIYVQSYQKICEEFRRWFWLLNLLFKYEGLFERVC